MLTDFIDGALLQVFYLIPLLLQTHVAIERSRIFLQTFSNFMQLVTEVHFKLIYSISDVVIVPSLPRLQLQNHHGLGWVQDYQSLTSLQVVHPILEWLYYLLITDHLKLHQVIYLFQLIFLVFKYVYSSWQCLCL
jgi:hypothetical protein